MKQMTDIELTTDLAERIDFCMRCNLINSSIPVCLLREIMNRIHRKNAEIESLKESRDRWRRLAEDFDRITREEEKAAEAISNAES